MAKRKKNQQRLKVWTQNFRTGRTERVDADKLKGPLDLSDDECREIAVMRVTLNLREAKHPFHHKTGSGVIVTPDPTLEYYLGRMSEEKRKQFYEIYTPTPAQEAQAPNAIPVNRKFYGHDPYEGR